MAVHVERRQFTVAEYERMVAAGILAEDDRVELVEGEVIAMSPIGSRHTACVKRLNALLVAWAGPVAIVSVQDPIHLDDYNEPQPDLALLRPRADYYASGHPRPADVLLVIEVADTSLAYDRGVKLLLYAQAAIPEAWVVDLANGTIAVYAQPANGIYRSTSQVELGQTLVSLTLPGLTFSVSSILG